MNLDDGFFAGPGEVIGQHAHIEILREAGGRPLRLES